MLDYANGREYSEQTAYRFRYALKIQYTNSTTRAFILFLFLIAEYHYFCFQLLEQLVVAVVELVQQFEINRQMNLFVRYRGENGYYLTLKQSQKSQLLRLRWYELRSYLRLQNQKNWTATSPRWKT